MSTEAILKNEKKTRRPFVLASLIIAMFMAAIEGTIVATAMPSIVGELGGFTLYSWVFSAFLLMNAVTTPIYGKLSDLFVRKPIYMIGILFFLTVSLLFGFAFFVLFYFVLFCYIDDYAYCFSCNSRTWGRSSPTNCSNYRCGYVYDKRTSKSSRILI